MLAWCNLQFLPLWGYSTERWEPPQRLIIITTEVSVNDLDLLMREVINTLEGKQVKVHYSALHVRCLSSLELLSCSAETPLLAGYGSTIQSPGGGICRG